MGWIWSAHNAQLLQGMAMGAQVNIVDSVHIFIAIAAHKGLAAYALGSSVVDSQARPYRAALQGHAECHCVPSVVLAIAACVCTPLGHTCECAQVAGSNTVGHHSLVLCPRSCSLLQCRLQAGMRKFWTVIGLFASATPVGIMLGVLLSTVANSDGAASVSALASGAAHSFMV